jgi:hypothetical protein
MSVFDGIAEATYNEGGNYLHPGSYDLEIVKLKVGQTRKKDDFFAADLKILGTTSDMRIGEIANFFTSTKQERALFLGNVKGFAKALLSATGEIDDGAITPEVMDGICDKNGAAVVGARIRVQVTQVPTLAGGTYSRHTWMPAGATAQLTSAA